MSGAERRASVRVPVRFEVYSHESNYLISYTENISAEGMFLCTEKLVPVGTHLKLVFSIEDLHEVVVTAKVIVGKPSRGKGGYRTGFRVC